MLCCIDVAAFIWLATSCSKSISFCFSYSAWRLLHRPPPGVAITDVDVFSNSIALYERRAGRPAITVLRFGNTGDWIT